jgi:ubiquinone/menaquinone biosynthesis C-methylase UbiE
MVNGMDKFKQIWPANGPAPVPWEEFQDGLDRHYRYEKDFQVRYMHRSRIHAFLGLYPSIRDMDVLEVGCSAGGYVVLARSMGARRVAGVDVDKDALRRAREWAAQQRNGAGIAMSVASVTELPFPDETFDLVICTEVLEHVPDARAGLAEIFRVLRLGGTLAVSLPNVVSYFWGVERCRPVRAIARMMGRRCDDDWEFLQHLRFPFWRTLWLVRAAGFEVRRRVAVNVLPLPLKVIVPRLMRWSPGLVRGLVRFDQVVGRMWPFCYLGTSLFLDVQKPAK